MIPATIPAYRARIARKSTDQLLIELELLQIYTGRDAETRRALLLEELRKRLPAALHVTREPVTT